MFVLLKIKNIIVKVTERAMQAEIVKNQVQKVKEKAEILVECIAKEKALAEQKLEAAKPALEEAEAALNTIKPAHIGKHIIFINTFIAIQNYIYYFILLRIHLWMVEFLDHLEQ